MGLVGIISDSTMLLFVVLVLGAVSGYFSERVGIVNIAINGQMIFGAMMFVIFANVFEVQLGKDTQEFYMSFPAPMLLAAVCTIPVSTIFGFLTIKLKTNQAVAGTAINMLTAGLGMFLTQPLGPIVSNGQFTKLTSSYLSLHQLGNSTGFYLTTLLIFIFIFILILGLWLMVKFTPFGLRLRAIGNNPNAVDSQGINVIRYQWISVTISGMLAGLAGAILMFSRGGTFEGNVSGYGFLALAILIAGSWRIPLILIVSLAFSLITKVFLTVNLGSTSSNGVTTSLDPNVAKVIPYLITLAGMVLFSKWTIVPKHLGIPFDKSSR